MLSLQSCGEAGMGHEEETGPISLGSFPESAGSFQLFLLAPAVQSGRGHIVFSTHSPDIESKTH